MNFIHDEFNRVIRSDPEQLTSSCRDVFQNEKSLKSDRFEAFHSAVRTGLEPATPCVTGTYSNQLNYRTITTTC